MRVSFHRSLHGRRHWIFTIAPSLWLCSWTGPHGPELELGLGCFFWSLRLIVRT